MKKAIKELLADRRSLKEAAVVTVLVPLVRFAMHLIGWGHGTFSWAEAILGALLTGVFYWIVISGIRRVRNQDVTPS
ncbi:MAG: hypothetical protein L0J17_07590 [Brevibacterium sp.]|nr:hypothetical protein [Brevibacterium sp.]MDN5908163.1 hypothetical protein [Brevibacterium sp.]MDN6135356.1 hypothetical protein [Brevibacterium sp.]MDN6158471.1 hypothetical protein [Brevibacterium sp.]MDN6175240.1 hypothetical protein [Brevibacterium sp.]